MRRAVLTVLALLCAPVLAPAQQDPSREIQELARRIEEQMQAIDRLLLETSKPSADAGKTPKELLQQSRAESQAVRETIDELIEKLNQMKQSGGQGSSGSDQQGGEPQPQQGQQQGQGQQGEQQNRRDSGAPEFMPQPGSQEEQQGQQQQQQPQPQPGQRQPLSGDPDAPGGENRPGQLPPDDGTAPGQPGTGETEWGQLQGYENFLKHRGSPPKVQEKYRRFWEAYLKSRPDRQR